MPSFMEPLGSRSRARSWQLKERHIARLHPPPLQQRLPAGLESGWMFQARPAGSLLPCRGAQIELDSVAQPWGKLPASHPSSFRPGICSSVLWSLFYFLI